MSFCVLDGGGSSAQARELVKELQKKLKKAKEKLEEKMKQIDGRRDGNSSRGEGFQSDI